MKPDSNFGDETYFGQDVIFPHDRTGTCSSSARPIPFDNKANPDFKVEKANPARYPFLRRVFDLVRVFESDLYGGSLVPVIIAHRHASISRVPGGKVLDIAAQIKFAEGKATGT